MENKFLKLTILFLGALKFPSYKTVASSAFAREFRRPRAVINLLPSSATRHGRGPQSSQGGGESVTQGGTFCWAHMWPASGDSDAIKARVREDDGRERKAREKKEEWGRKRAGWTSLFANLSESHVRWCAHPRARTEDERERERACVRVRVPCIMHVHRSLVSDGGPAAVSKKRSLLRPVWEWTRLSITRDVERDAIHYATPSRSLRGTDPHFFSISILNFNS